MIRVAENVILNDGDIHERFVRAMGPGGQNARREETAVELRFDIDASSLPKDVRERLVTLGGHHVTRDGVLVIVSRAFRSQPENREAAHRRLLALLQKAARPDKERRATKPRRIVRERRKSAKMRLAATKRSRRRPRVGNDLRGD
jgi:ribosome-associated protein